MSSPKTAVTLNPVPGFCVKSKALQQTVVRRTATDVSRVHSDVQGVHKSPAPSPIPIPKGLKIFINIAWDANVPPPPPGSDDAIQKAMLGDDSNELSVDEPWFVPVVVSDGRQDTDKDQYHIYCYRGAHNGAISSHAYRPAGQPSIVFDCIFNSSVKSRTLKDPEFKAFVIELALQRIETQTSISLSRQISTPNIASKGKPETRQISVPTALYPDNHPNHRSSSALIQEIPPSDAKVTAKPDISSAPKGILKPQAGSSTALQTPAWSWTKTQSKTRIAVEVPNLTHGEIPSSTLDIEPRRVILKIPPLYELDINLAASDAELMAKFAKSNSGDAALSLKRMRDLEVDTAKAEWRVADKTIIISV
ncbi:hypothetical protein BJ138DRAFT_1112913 [Hygrophoropsis aurantiaca]|uniref:Uncharacterized protein n=1 Tax=Hygrophoropsis aurantiaca TaxID=72124 RepID=A0ACB8AED8_9AGAM|nr:hypothetical protein BJ138DRAFT_1112913 [Hygrophoropsis aurantiaca]